MLFILFMTLPIMSHVLILPLLWDIAGRDAWISALMAAPFGFLIAYMIWKWINIRPGMTLYELTNNLWGPLFRSLFKFIWLANFLFISVITLIGLIDMMQAGFYQDTPIWFIGAAFMVFIVYCLTRGIQVISWLAGLTMIFVMVSGHAISISLDPLRDWRQVLPILEFGWSPPILGAVLLCSIWTDMFTVAVLHIQHVETRGMLYTLWLFIFANMIMTLSVTIGTIAVFGWEQTDTLLYPVLSSVRMVTLGFIDRFDVYGLILMTFGTLIRQAFFLHAVVEMLPYRPFIQKHRKWMVSAVGTIIYILSLSMFRNKLYYDEMLKNYILVLVLWPLPILYLIRGWNQARK